MLVEAAQEEEIAHPGGGGDLAGASEVSPYNGGAKIYRMYMGVFMSEYTGIQSGETDHTQDLGLVVYLVMIFTFECNMC